MPDSTTTRQRGSLGCSGCLSIIIAIIGLGSLLGFSTWTPTSVLGNWIACFVAVFCGLPILKMAIERKFTLIWATALVCAAYVLMKEKPLFTILAAGNAGLVIGYILMLIFQGQKFLYRSGVSSTYSRHYAPSAFMVGLFSLLAKIAKADGTISEPEALFIRTHFLDPIRDERMKQEIKQIFNAARDNATPDYREFAEMFGQSFRLYANQNPLLYLALFCELAEIDGPVTPLKRRILETIEEQLGVRGAVARFLSGDTEWQVPGRTPTLSAEACYAVMECEPSVSDDELKRIYRAKCKAYHPDRMQGRGEPPEAVELAKLKMQKINEAYAVLCKLRNIK